MGSARLARFVFVFLAVVSAACSSKAPTGPSEPDATSIVITAQPQSLTVAPGATATLSVGASGPAPMVFQWYNGVAGQAHAPIPGATAASYTTPALAATTNYWVRISSGTSVADSATATVAISASVPNIAEQPENETVAPGQSVRLTVEATGSGPFSYQWFKRTGSSSVPIEGAVEAAYTTPPLTESASYWVRVSNASGSVDSVTVTITVTSAPNPNPNPSPNPGPGPNPNPPPPPPPPPPGPDTATPFEDEVLVLINQRRAAGATCGGTPYAPVGPLSMNPNLRQAARAHSQDMATQNYFSHTSLDGRTFSQRMSDAGYTGGGSRGENIAAGYSTAAAAVNGWMTSTGHCQNIMNGSYRVAGVGYAYGAASSYGTYWTMNFGSN